jgi:hypothetical protein
MRETITGVALFRKDGLVSLPKPHRHHHLFALIALLGIHDFQEKSAQGFVTSLGRFVDREEGLAVAILASQVKMNDRKRELFSEDLW